MVVLESQGAYAVNRITTPAHSSPARTSRRNDRSARNSIDRSPLSSARPLTVTSRRRSSHTLTPELGGDRTGDVTSSTAARGADRMVARISTSQREHDDAFQRARRQAHNELEQQYETWYSQMEQRTRATRQQRPEPAPPAPAPPQHRVYLVNCGSCGAFLTDRGMKAVLLLRPHITLFSTDAMPNCGPLHAPSRFSEPSLPSEPIVERTCDCLTQTLGCYGCGSAVGYHIVSPCSRCTGSVSKHQRSSNGHRTVLHCAEISVRERRYVPGEPGVRVAPFQSAKEALHSGRTVQPVSFRFQQNVNLHFRGPSMGSDYDAESDDEDFCDDDEAFEQLEKNTSVDSYAEHAGLHRPRALKRGDPVYWSDLVTGGERTAPIDSDDLLDMPVNGR